MHPVGRRNAVMATVMAKKAAKLHQKNVELHLGIFRDRTAEQIGDVLFRYLLWSKQATDITTSLRTAFETVSKPNNLMHTPIIKMVKILYTFHYVLNIIVDYKDKPFDAETRHINMDRFASIGEYLTNIWKAAEALFGAFLPSNLEKSLRQQWQELSLQTDVPAESMIELAVQCVCFSLNPKIYTPCK
jgi:hypothetical protein